MTDPIDKRALATICPLCGLLQRVPAPAPGTAMVCAQCGCRLRHYRPHGTSRTMAFATAALIMYAPANMFPIMNFEYYGASEPATVLSGVIRLAESGMWFIAAVVFMASVVVPLIKLVTLLFLGLSFRTGRNAQWKTRLYRIIRAVGPWAMLDIFLLAVLVGVVKLGQFANVTPGPAALPFLLLVVFTILATESFDPSLLWEHSERLDREEKR